MKEYLAEFRRQFKNADTDRSGYLEKNEIMNMMALSYQKRGMKIT